MMRKILAFVVLILFLVSGWAVYQHKKILALDKETEQSTKVIKTHERIRNADVGRGDSNDDSVWLCKRAGRGDCGS